MRESSSRLITVLIGDVSTDFTTELMAGIADAAAQRNVQLLFLLGMQKHSSPLGFDPEHNDPDHNSVYDYTSLIDSDAFIIACGSLTGFSGGGVTKEFLTKFSDLPYVVLQQKVELETDAQTYIVVDNYQSFSQCIEHLIVAHGYRKIALLAGPKGHPDAKERTRAYLDCMNRHALPVADSMIANGDYSEFVDPLVSQLIDRNPRLEAIAFENDEMAKAGYRECRRRGLVVGRDIAITGFDNFNSGRTMEPPLTTVSQDIYQMGHMALDRVIQLLEGHRVPPTEMRTEFLQRQSCGCSRRPFQFLNLQSGSEDSLIDAVIQEIETGYAQHFEREVRENELTILHSCFSYLRRLSLNAPAEPLDYNELASQLDLFFTAYDQPTQLLSQCLDEFLLWINTAHLNSPAVGKFASAVSYMQHYIHSREVKTLLKRLDTYNNQSWIAPELTRGLFSEADEENIFLQLVERLAQFGLRNVYICLLEQKKIQPNGRFLPQTLRLAAHASPRSAMAYTRDQRPVVDAQHPLRSLPELSGIHTLMAFSLFSGRNQYGLLLCDVDRTRSGMLHMIGLQLGMLFDYLGLRTKERMISEELENIREKNEILNFLSEYDSLCELLNRRGFIEQAIRLNRANIGKTAYCLFIDLDFLKQINDTFGHSEGDTALRGVSAILKKIEREGDLLGRIGGDEFVGLFLSDKPDFETSLRQQIREECDQYNQHCGSPYWLDISVGIASFVCRQGLEVSSVIAQADQRMYEAKHCRTHCSLRTRQE